MLLGLFAIAAVASALAGYASGVDPNRTKLPGFVMAFLVTAIICLIMDLDRRSSGFITNTQQPMMDGGNHGSGEAVQR